MSKKLLKKLVTFIYVLIKPQSFSTYSYIGFLIFSMRITFVLLPDYGSYPKS